MSASFYDLLKFAKTGIASPDMTAYDKQKALAMCKAGFPVKTLTGVPPISFKSDGTPLLVWTVVGNERQTGTPTPSAPIQPQECGDLVETGYHAGEYAVPITLAGQTQNIYLSEPLRKIGDYGDTVSSDGTVTRRVKKLVLTWEEDWYIAVEETHLFGVQELPEFDGNEFVPRAIAICDRYNYNSVQSGIDAATANGDFALQHYVSPDGTIIKNNIFIKDSRFETESDLKTYLQQQYAAGTPVTVWYVLATAQTETVTVPTLTPTKGSNTLTVGTTLAPSSVSITGGIK